MTEQFVANSEHYLHFLSDVKSKILSTRIEVARTANRRLVQFYWWLGSQIVKRQKEFGWGKSVVEQLAKDLRVSFPNTRGFSVRNLWQTRQLYLEYKNEPNLQPLVAEIPWAHNVLILNKIKNSDERRFYLKNTAKMGWTRNVLSFQIESDLYHRQRLEKQHNFEKVLPKHLAAQADAAMKSIYMLDMLGLKQPVSEAVIEMKMVEKIKRVMLELGYGFSFIGNQYPIRANNKDYFIDLLFFNRRLQSLVAAELKVGEFKPEYAGKMNFYLNLLDDFVRERHENPSIGIILCNKQDKFEVDYALKGIGRPVGVANYELTKKLPKKYINKLPTTDFLEMELSRHVRMIE